ncbi:glutathione S-transferase family protein [Sphingomonas sp. 1P06PA]|uniref:glutathione S-transferase family protein n=1 Tax=Sphingomonas sp. 1P06PA TaxID=554121 RepID=UPI0039A51A0D
MLTVHHLGISQSDRIVWLCEELGIDYDLKRYERDPVTKLAPPAYRALHPFGTAPVISDGDLVLGESGAIIDYIVERHGGGRLRPKPEDADFADYLFWFHFANGSLMPAGMVDMVLAMTGGGADGNATLDGVRDRLERGYRMVEARLGEVDFFAGERFTAADIIMLFPLTTMRAFAPRDLGPYPNIRAYLARIGERPAFQRAMRKAEPDFPPMLG